MKLRQRIQALEDASSRGADTTSRDAEAFMEKMASLVERMHGQEQLGDSSQLSPAERFILACEQNDQAAARCLLEGALGRAEA